MRSPLAELIGQLVANIGAFASVCGLLWASGATMHWPAWFLFALFLILISLQIFYSIDQFRSCGIKHFKDKESVNSYMKKLLTNAGRSAIYTRDMTWASKEDVKELLLKKALNGELQIICPEETVFMSQLRKAGAEILDYPAIKFNPNTRFTITNVGTGSARVAVGKQVGSGGKYRHVVREAPVDGDPFAYIAQDMVDFIRGYKANAS